MPLVSEYAAFVQEAPVIEIQGTIAIVKYAGLRDRAMPIRIFRKSVDRANRALQAHAAGDEHVIVDD